jgi:hypothetical protein
MNECATWIWNLISVVFASLLLVGLALGLAFIIVGMVAYRPKPKKPNDPSNP